MCEKQRQQEASNYPSREDDVQQGCAVRRDVGVKLPYYERKHRALVVAFYSNEEHSLSSADNEIAVIQR
jgi:hypothetical protein